MLMEEAFRNDTFIPIENSQKPVLISLLSLWSLGIPGNVILLIFCLPRSNFPGLYLLYFVCILDVIFFITLATTEFITVLNGGYSIGEIGCKLQYFFILGAIGGTVLNITAIAFERHMSVCFKRPLKVKEILCILFFIAGFSLMFGGLVPFSPESNLSIDYQSHNFVCTHAWYSSYPNARLITLLAIIILPISISYICFAYLSVYNTFKLAFTAARQNLSGSSTAPDTKEMEVFKTCAIITALFFFTWSPYLIRIVLEIATKQPVSGSFAFATELFAIMNSFLDPYVLMIFDNRIKGTMKRTTIGKFVSCLFEKKQKPKPKQRLIKTAKVSTQDDQTRIIIK